MKLRWMAMSAAMGAAIMYFFDPRSGESRRQALGAKLSSGSEELHVAARQAGDTVEDVAAASRGVIDEAERVGETISDPPRSEAAG